MSFPVLLGEIRFGDFHVTLSSDDHMSHFMVESYNSYTDNTEQLYGKNRSDARAQFEKSVRNVLAQTKHISPIVETIN